MNESVKFIGGLAKRTEIFNSEGKLIPVEKIDVDSTVLSADGSFSKVVNVRKFNDDVVTVKQKSKHWAHLRDQKRTPPWGLIEMRLSKRQKVSLRTKQRIKQIAKSSSDCITVEVTQLRDHLTEDGRTIKTLRTTSKKFRENCLSETIQGLIDSTKIQGGFIEWESELQDLRYLNKELRASTRILLAPLILEKPVLLTWLEKHFQRKVSNKQLAAMAWLLGFWIGDGYRRGAQFALHSGDDDVNNNLKIKAQLWGMELRRAQDGFKADGYLHTFHGGARHWNAHNPFVEVLKGLKFYENGRPNGKKNIPAFLRLESRVIREEFMAGLIDSDGSVNIQDHIIRVKIPTAYALIRDGILFISRSLGLNVSVHFHHERENPRGYHESDTWIFHILGGTNHSVLWSILDRCSCERKRNPPIQFVATVDIEEYERDSYGPVEINTNELSEDEESLKINERVSRTATESTGYGRSSNESQLENVDGTDELRAAVIPFDLLSAGNEEVFQIILSADSHSTLVGDGQIICSSAEQVVDGTISDTNYKRKWLSCHEVSTPGWYKLPWKPTSPSRLCTACYNHCSRSNARCYNCCKIYGKSIMHQKSKRESKKSHKLQNGMCIQGYPCDYCVGVVVQYEVQKAATNPQDNVKPGSCFTCRSKLSGCWRKVPWNPTREWCGVCRSRYGNTATICSNERCKKIPVKGELSKMEMLDGVLGHYKCLRCGSIARRDMRRKCAAVKKLEARHGECYSCGPVISKRWSSLPWDKKASAEICHTCYLLLRAYKGRCLNPDCRRIFRKVEVTKMKNLEPIEGPSSGGPKCRPCIKCHGHTTVF